MRTLCNATVIASLAIVGCATQAPVGVLSAAPPPAAQLLKIQFDSRPLGATVMRDGRALGRTPFVHAEQVSASTQEGHAVLACDSGEPVTVLWESGASITINNLCSQYPTVTAVRPAAAPGLEDDLRVEAQVRSNRALAARWYAPPRYGFVSSLRGPGRGVVSGYDLVRTPAGAYGVAPNAIPMDHPGSSLPLKNPQRE